jgi:hypothetical protein
MEMEDMGCLDMAELKTIWFGKEKENRPNYIVMTIAHCSTFYLFILWFDSSTSYKDRRLSDESRHTHRYNKIK